MKDTAYTITVTGDSRAISPGQTLADPIAFLGLGSRRIASASSALEGTLV